VGDLPCDNAPAQSAFAFQDGTGGIAVLKRSSAIVAAAKQRSPLVCDLCGFNFEETYGELDRGYIECHHIEPLVSRNGEPAPTRVGDLALLCANCHCMVH